MVKRLALVALVATGLITNPILSAVRNISSLTEFNNEIKKDNVTVVKVSTSWCGPCKASDPMYNQLATQYPNATFLKVLADGPGSQIAQSLRANSVPTFIVYKSGKVLRRFSGLQGGIPGTRNAISSTITNAK